MQTKNELELYILYLIIFCHTTIDCHFEYLVFIVFHQSLVLWQSIDYIRCNVLF